MIRKWEILDRKVLHDYHFMQLETKKARSPRTGKAADVMAIHFPDWVVVLALTAAEEVIMIRQYRHGSEHIHLELPGGLIDPGDSSPLEAARRELLEETGYRSRNCQLLGACFPQPAVLSNKCFICLAGDAEYQQVQALDEGEDIDVVKIPMIDVPEKIKTNEIDNAMTQLAFFHFWMLDRASQL